MMGRLLLIFPFDDHHADAMATFQQCLGKNMGVEIMKNSRSSR